MGYMAKQKRKQTAIRFPLDVYRYIEKVAKAKHGGNFTAATIEMLYEAKKYLEKVERWKREGAARDAEAMSAQRERQMEAKDGTSP